MLLAGSSADATPAWPGAFAFAVISSTSNAWWNCGSANMLIAGARATGTLSYGGALAFDVDAAPAWTA